MNFLLDTCTFLWICRSRGDLSPKAAEVVADSTNQLYLSAVSAWEVMVKASMGRLTLPHPPDQFLLIGCRQHQIEPLPFRMEDSFPLAELPRIHKDPFDRMLVCQAIEQSLAILTPDPLITQYSIQTLW